MSQNQPEKTNSNFDNISREQKFSDLSKGLFFLVSTISLIIAMFMFIFIWQPIWSKGFNDFHTITNAINQLNKTAKPATETVPLMLVQMTEMNKSIQDMQNIMQDMNISMNNLEQITPQLVQMNTSIENMTMVLSTQMGRMTFLIDEMESRFTPSGMMPYNW